MGCNIPPLCSCLTAVCSFSTLSVERTLDSLTERPPASCKAPSLPFAMSDMEVSGSRMASSLGCSAGSLQPTSTMVFSPQLLLHMSSVAPNLTQRSASIAFIQAMLWLLLAVTGG